MVFEWKKMIEKEILSTHKDVELGERDIRVSYHNIIHYRIYAHITKNQEQIYYIYYFTIKNGNIKEYFRIVNKRTVIIMLSRFNEIYEDKIQEFIPNFESERLKIQLRDRLFDYEQILTDKEIEQKINKVESFQFFGQHGKCKRAYPHLPHVIGFYNTVRYGILPIFCLGKSGKLLLSNGKIVQIMISKDCSEDCIGHYVIFELYEHE